MKTNQITLSKELFKKYFPSLDDRGYPEGYEMVWETPMTYNLLEGISIAIMNHLFLFGDIWDDTVVIGLPNNRGFKETVAIIEFNRDCLLYTSPSPRD